MTAQRDLLDCFLEDVVLLHGARTAAQGSLPGGLQPGAEAHTAHGRPGRAAGARSRRAAAHRRGLGAPGPGCPLRRRVRERPPACPCSCPHPGAVQHHGGLGRYRVTDAAALAAAVESAGSTRMEVEAALSRALSVGVVRRHARGAEGEGLHYGPAVRVASGNWVTGRRRGVVDGIDFGATGSGAGLAGRAGCLPT